MTSPSVGRCANSRCHKIAVSLRHCLPVATFVDGVSFMSLSISDDLRISFCRRAKDFTEGSNYVSVRKLGINNNNNRSSVNFPDLKPRPVLKSL